MASRDNKSLILLKHGAYFNEAQIAAELSERYDLIQLGLSIIKLTLKDAVSLNEAILGPEATRQQKLLASLGVIGLIGTQVILGIEVPQAKNRQDVFTVFETIKQDCAQGDETLGSFLIDNPPHDSDLFTGPTGLLDLREQDRLVLPTNLETLAMIEQIATNKDNHINLNNIYKSHDEELANLYMQRICPGVWYHPSVDFAQRGYNLGTTKAMTDFRKAARACGQDNTQCTYVMHRLAIYCCQTKIEGEQHRKEALEDVRNIFHRRYNSSPGLLLFENRTIKQAVDYIEKGGEIQGLKLKGYSLLKEVAQMIGETPISTKLIPVSEAVWITRQLNEADRDSGKYMTKADFVLDGQVVCNSKQGAYIFWCLVDHLTERGTKPSKELSKIIWSERTAESFRPAYYQTVLETQAIANLLEFIKAGGKIDGIGKRRAEQLEQILKDGDIVEPELPTKNKTRAELLDEGYEDLDPIEADDTKINASDC